MAGLGARLFPAFSKLTSAQVNGYLMDQTIMRFASVAARDAAFGGAGEPTLAEGMTCYLDDTNVLQSYNGTAWVTVVNTDRPAALELISGIGCSAGGTVTNGVVVVGTSVSAITVTNAFSAEYDNYKIIIRGLDQANNDRGVTIQLNNQTTAVYKWSYTAANLGTNTSFNVGASAVTSIEIGLSGTEDDFFAGIDISNPFVSNRQTIITSLMSTNNWRVWGGAGTTTAASNTGFTIASSQVQTGGTIRVYGYRNQL
jgi:hypothetical protein